VQQSAVSAEQIKAMMTKAKAQITQFKSSTVVRLYCYKYTECLWKSAIINISYVILRTPEPTGNG